MNITYKHASPDRDQIFTLFESTRWNEEYQLDREQLFRAIRQSWYSVSAYDAERLVGFGRVISDGILHAFIVDLIVSPGYQGCGIGGEILSRLVTRCQANGMRDIQLFCAEGKTNFYEKYGFVSRPDDAPGMEIKLRKPASVPDLSNAD